MSAFKIGWGGKIAILYGGFVLLIAALVTGSMRQDFDLVTDDYYQQELAYQDVLDAGKNQSALSAPADIYANATDVVITFPDEFKGKTINGKVHFYSPIDETWDKQVSLENTGAVVTVPRSELQNTRYTIKLSWDADAKNYYQESDINLF